MARNMIAPSMGSNVKKLLQRIADYPVIEPEDGKEYARNKYTFYVGDGELVRVNERQRNLAVLIATEPRMDQIEKMARAGYDIRTDTVFDKDTKQSTIANSWRAKYHRAASKQVIQLANQIQSDAAAQINVDAAWLLGQQISLYHDARSKDALDTAARILHDISGHVNIDARATNKVQIETEIDYASLLNAADKRIIDITPEVKVIKELPTLEEHGLAVEEAIDYQAKLMKESIDSDILRRVSEEANKSNPTPLGG